MNTTGPSLLPTALLFAGSMLFFFQPSIAQTTTYDALRRIILVDYGNGLTESYTYDDSGNRVTRTVTSPFSAPTIANHPSAQTATIGQPATFTALAAGNPAVSYQWRKAGSAIPGATNASYNITAVAPSDGVLYDVVATNPLGAATSASASLTVNRIAQIISFSAPTTKAFGDPPFALAATSTSGLSVTLSFVSGPATLSAGTVTITGAGTIVVRASQAGNATYAPAASVDRGIVVAPNFASWSQAHFTPAELADPAKSGPNAVFGADGVTNLVKYALGLSPKVDASTTLSPPTPLGNDWVVTYARTAGRIDVSVTVEASTNSSSWTTSGVTHELVSSSGGVETWRARYPTSSAPVVSFRLKVTR